MDLANNFPGDDLELSYDNDDMGVQFFAFSHHIDELSEPSAVAERLYSLQLLVNGSLMLAWKNANFMRLQFNGFAAGGVRHSTYANRIEETPFINTNNLRKGVATCDDSRNTCYTHLLSIAKTDLDIRTLLFLVGLISNDSPLESILTWGTLYKILDCVQHYSKSIGKKTEDFADKGEINKFTAACNNMSVLGLYARHGAANNSPPKNATTDLNKAIELIVSMASKFCVDYVAIKYPLARNSI
jgi:hypothetical protein